MGGTLVRARFIKRGARLRNKEARKYPCVVAGTRSDGCVDMV
jgi:hypothetical protein